MILLGPITTFLDQDVPEREVRPLFERSLKRVEKMAMEGVSFLIFQPLVFSNPPFAKGGVGGLKDSKRTYLSRQLIQFSNLVWRICLEGGGPQVVLEKGLTKVLPLTSLSKLSITP